LQLQAITGVEFKCMAPIESKMKTDDEDR